MDETKEIPDLTSRQLDSFIDFVDKSGDCWEWTGATKHKYGIFTMDQRQYRAHRVAWKIAFGTIPPGLCVCHKCDNPRCVRPAHLWLGTQEQNNEDKVKKYRHARAKGAPSNR